MLAGRRKPHPPKYAPGPGRAGEVAEVENESSICIQNMLQWFSGKLTSW